MDFLDVLRNVGEMVLPHTSRDPLSITAYVKDFNEWFLPAAQMALDQAEGVADYKIQDYAMAGLPIVGKFGKVLSKAGKIAPKHIHGIRYDVPNREMRTYNTTGKEKNPNKISFYAKNEETANKYKTLFDDEGYELDIPTKRTDADLEGRFFDMENEYKNTAAYSDYVEKEFTKMHNDYEKFKNEAKTKKQKKMWENNIKELEQNFENEAFLGLKGREFQDLSDFERQNILLKELTDAGYDGYETANEIAVFPK